MPARDHDKVKVIVEETVQHVYLLDPEDAKTRETVEKLQVLVTGEYMEHIPFAWDKPDAVLGKRAKKGPLMPAMTLQGVTEQAKYSVFSGLTVVIPDETGKEAIERRFTNKTVMVKDLRVAAKRKKR